ncbi:hypothetical protein [Crocosphaera sp. Alani8]|uniref:hypothetical protein n=1 Tax=Crocosphaera sp. Alani8 TaxID=3038952 RepID=UPI00313E6820
MTIEEKVEQLSQELEKVKKDNRNFKIILIISGVTATGLIIFSLEKNKRISKKFGQGLTQENTEAVSKIYKDFNRDLGDIQTTNNKITTEISKINQIITETKQTLEERIKTVERKISKIDNNQGKEFVNTNLVNHSSSSVPSDAIEVSETEKSSTDRRLGKSKIVILEKKLRGNYLVYTEGMNTYLIPSNNLRVNQYNYKTIEALFECRNYRPNYSSNFQVIQPAMVNSISSDNSWQLQERGVLEF